MNDVCYWPGCGRPADHNKGVLDIPANHTPSRERRVIDLITKWQPRLGLQDWDIRYNPNRKIRKHSLANNTHSYVYHICEIGVQSDCPDSELEACVLHEMLHPVVNPLVDRALALAGTGGDERVGIMLMDELHEMREALIERMVRALLDRHTLPFGKRIEKEFASFVEAA